MLLDDGVANSIGLELEGGGILVKVTFVSNYNKSCVNYVRKYHF
jgi:hypothetical protein